MRANVHRYMCNQDKYNMSSPFADLLLLIRILWGPARALCVKYCVIGE